MITKILRCTLDLALMFWMFFIFEVAANKTSIYVFPIALTLSGLFLVLLGINRRVESRKKL